ncbi:MAG: WG repeat-containing protein [Firmicutes bacterium]|nr:WG repeat-containing protein [Bacillota bacterium]
MKKNLFVLMLAAVMLLTGGLAACNRKPNDDDMRPSAGDMKYFHSGLVSAQNEDGKYGFINDRDETKIAFQYDYASGFFFDGAAMIQQNGKYFLIDAKGNELSQRYDEITPLPQEQSLWYMLLGISMDNAMFLASNNGAEKADFLSCKGKKIFELETSKFKLYDLSGNYLIVTDGAAYPDTKRGVIDITTGKTVYKTEYDGVGHTPNWTSDFGYDNYFRLYKDGKCALGDAKGKVLTEFKYASIESWFSHGLGWAKMESTPMAADPNTHILLDTSGKEVFTKEGSYTMGSYDSKGIAYFYIGVGAGRVKGYMDRSGNELISVTQQTSVVPSISETLEHESGSDFIVRRSFNAGYRVYTVYDVKGNKLNEFGPGTESELYLRDKGNVLYLFETVDGITTVTPLNGKAQRTAVKIVLEASEQFDLNDSEHGMTTIRRSDGNHRIVDKTGKKITDGRLSYSPSGFDEILGFFKDAEFLCFQKDGKIGYLDFKGNVVVPANFDDAIPPIAGAKLYGVMNDGGKWGFADKNGALKIAAKYDLVLWFLDGLAMVRLDGKFGFVDESGAEVVAPLYTDINGMFSILGLFGGGGAGSPGPA